MASLTDLEEELCNNYLVALNEMKLDKLLPLFTPDGVVVSPLLGEVHVRSFYEDLFQNTSNASTQLIGRFKQTNSDPSRPNMLTLYFKYTWTVKSGKVVSLACVDVFELKDNKFSKLLIVYDTAPVRGALGIGHTSMFPTIQAFRSNSSPSIQRRQLEQPTQKAPQQIASNDYLTYLSIGFAAGLASYRLFTFAKDNKWI